MAQGEVAEERAEFIWNLDSTIGLTHKELLSVCQFIEKHSSDGSNRVFSQSETKLPCVIERISSLNGFLVRDLPGGRSKIGSGCHKIVQKAILYTQKPKIIADCLSDASGAREISILKKLKDCRGIVPFLGSVARSKNQYSIFLEYFSEGSLLSKLKWIHEFSVEQKLKIARDCARGLKSMHALHLIHRDLHAGNILLRRTPSGLLEAALVDFGKTMNIHQAGDGDVPQAAKSRNPPEALITPFSKLRRYPIDIYAMGCNYYYMAWNQSVPWRGNYNVYALHTYAYSRRVQIYKRILDQYRREKLKKIGSLLEKEQKGMTLSPLEKFQILIFEMIDSDPARRPNASTVLKRLQKMAT